MLSFFGPMDATPTSVHTSSGEGVACFTEWRRWRFRFPRPEVGPTSSIVTSRTFHVIKSLINRRRRRPGPSTVPEEPMDGLSLEHFQNITKQQGFCQVGRHSCCVPRPSTDSSEGGNSTPAIAFAQASPKYTRSTDIHWERRLIDPHSGTEMRKVNWIWVKEGRFVSFLQIIPN